MLSVPVRAADDREIRSRVAPVYPEAARRKKIIGAVRVEALVDANGSVRSAKAIEGNRLLASAAESAVRRWKFSAAAAPSRVQVELRFDMAE